MQRSHPSWSYETIQAVLLHEIVIGMDYDTLHASIGGVPTHINETHLPGGHTSTQLVYVPCNCWTDLVSSWHFTGYVYLEDGIVTAFQTTH